MGLLDVARQVKGILPKRFGGTGNKMGWGEGVVVPYFNVSGADIPVGTIVQQVGNGGARMEPCDTLDSVELVGVVVGWYPDGITLLENADCPDQELGAVMLAGRCRVLVAENVTRGEYAFQSSTDGEARGDATAAAGAFGIFESIGDSGNLAYVRLFGTVLLSGGGSTSPLTTKGDLYGYDTADARVPVGSNGQVLTANSSDAQGVDWQAIRRAFIVTLNSPTNGQQFDLRIPWAATIVKWTLLADAAGSIVLDLWKDTYANAPPTVADTITASAKPTLSTVVKNESSTLTGWTTSCAAGDVIRGNVDSTSGLTRATLILEVTTP